MIQRREENGWVGAIASDPKNVLDTYIFNAIGHYKTWATSAATRWEHSQKLEIYNNIQPCQSVESLTCSLVFLTRPRRSRNASSILARVSRTTIHPRTEDYSLQAHQETGVRRTDPAGIHMVPHRDQAGQVALQTRLVPLRRGIQVGPLSQGTQVARRVHAHGARVRVRDHVHGGLHAAGYRSLLSRSPRRPDLRTTARRPVPRGIQGSLQGTSACAQALPGNRAQRQGTLACAPDHLRTLAPSRGTRVGRLATGGLRMRARSRAGTTSRRRRADRTTAARVPAVRRRQAYRTTALVVGLQACRTMR